MVQEEAEGGAERPQEASAWQDRERMAADAGPPVWSVLPAADRGLLSHLRESSCTCQWLCTLTAAGARTSLLSGRD